jgi:hypothetical protein
MLFIFSVKKVGEIEKNYKINLDLNLGDSITENLLRFVSKLAHKISVQ